MTIRNSNKYDLFVHDKTNRPITDKDKPKLRLLTESMSKYGFLPFPILVKKQGDKFKILDGQHRFDCAKKLGIPVLYVETDRSDVVIAETAAAQTPWQLFHYVESFASQGLDHFKQLKQFVLETGIPIGSAASLLSGHIGSNGKKNNCLRDGSFRVRDRDFAYRVAALLSALRSHVRWALTSNCIICLSRFALVSDFDDARMIQKIGAHAHLLKNCATVDQFSEMFDSVYNHSSKQRMPLAFLAKEAASNRNPINKRELKKAA